MAASKEDIKNKASEINKIALEKKAAKGTAADALKFEIEESAKFSLEHAFKVRGISADAKKALLDILKEDKDAIKILFVGENEQDKSIKMLSPLLGYKAKEFVETFRKTFNALQEEIASQKKAYLAG